MAAAMADTCSGGKSEQKATCATREGQSCLSVFSGGWVCVSLNNFQPTTGFASFKSWRVVVQKTDSTKVLVGHGFVEHAEVQSPFTPAT